MQLTRLDQLDREPRKVVVLCELINEQVTAFALRPALAETQQARSSPVLLSWLVARGRSRRSTHFAIPEGV